MAVCDGYNMRTVDPDLWFGNIRRSSPDTWALQSTDAHFGTRLRHSLEDAFGEFWLHCSARRLNLVTSRCATSSGSFVGLYIHCTLCKDASGGNTCRQSSHGSDSVSVQLLSVVEGRRPGLVPYLICSDTFKQLGYCATSGWSLRNKLGVVLTVAVAVSVVAYCGQESYLRPPLVMNLVCAQCPVTGVPFPAVAICNNNLVSRRNLEELTHFLTLSGRVSNYSEEMIRDHLLYFAALVMMTVPETQFDYDLTQLLLGSNVTDIMYQLSPKCSSFLKNCAWRGSPLECWKLFAMRLTPLGYCCVFNGRYQPYDTNTPPKTLDVTGQSGGLVVEVTQDDGDAAYLRRQMSTAMEVLIFDGTEYPLLESGVTRLYPGKVNSSTFFSIRVTTYNTSKSLEHTSEEWRGCRFRDIHEAHLPRRSYGWCLLDCRQWYNDCVCDCVPYMLLPRGDHVVCRPHNLACLDKYKDSFKYLYPHNNTEPGLDEERQASEYCPHCRQDCARPMYSAEVFHVPYTHRDKLFPGLGSEKSSLLSNSTVAHFFYSSSGHELYRVAVNVPWYEDVTTASCLWMLFVNMTAMTAAELVFHVAVRWGHHYLRRGERRQRRWLTHLVLCFRECTKADGEELQVHNYT